MLLEVQNADGTWPRAETSTKASSKKGGKQTITRIFLLDQFSSKPKQQHLMYSPSFLFPILYLLSRRYILVSRQRQRQRQRRKGLPQSRENKGEAFFLQLLWIWTKQQRRRTAR